jgi:3-dehydroquinate dehydratase II
MRVLVLNGPNLNRLGTREPEVYGDTTLKDLEGLIERWGAALGIETRLTQSNHEGELVDAIHQADGVDGLIINPGALTHTSRSIGDAISSVGLPAVEVHISNVKRREPWRATSLVAASCVRTIFGRGTVGYQDALRHLQNRAATPFDTVGYGPHRDNVGDIRRPVNDASGIVILVHGGLWRQEYERDSTETLAVDLTGRGYVTWNIEYRRGSGGGWPGPAHDVVSAVDFIVREMPGMPVGIVGHSAGGHLGLWAALRREDAIALTVGLAPITDLVAMAGSGNVGSRDAKRLLGSGAPPSMEPIAGKTLLVHGEDDEIVPVSHTTRLSTGSRIELVPGMRHFHMLDPNREHWPLVVAELGKALV